MSANKQPPSRRWYLALLGCCGSLALSLPAQAGPLVIWPVNPTLASGEQATQLWVHNRGAQPLTLQIRVLAWRQRGAKDVLTPQRAVVASPPFATVAAGEPQLVRLVHVGGPAPADPERAFRVLVDEIPSPTDPDRNANIRFQMRYSLPLFVGAVADPQRSEATLSKRGDLRFCIEGGGAAPPRLRVENGGPQHMRLSHVAIRLPDNSEPVVVSQGLLGYVLRDSAMTWPMSETVSGQLSRATATLTFQHQRRSVEVSQRCVTADVAAAP